MLLWISAAEIYEQNSHNQQAMIVPLLILLNLTHWAADYTHLSTAWMLSAKRFGRPLFPIFIHAWVHAMLMGVVLMFFVDSLQMWWQLFAIQLGTHFVIDVLKGHFNFWVPAFQSPANKAHWYLFGADQLLHQAVLILIAYLAVGY